MASYLDIATAFVSGLKVPAASKTLDGRQRLYAGELNDRRPALFSYGPHFPALIRDAANDRWLLNNEDYHPSEGERYAAGFRGTLYGRRDVRFSPATRNQLQTICGALNGAGLKDTGAREFGPGGHEYAVWMRPDSPYRR
jgi:hypothetical protein